MSKRKNREKGGPAESEPVISRDMTLRIKLGFAVSIVVLTAVAVGGWFQLNSRIDHAGVDRITRSDFENWLKLFRAQNPSVTVPECPESHRHGE